MYSIIPFALIIISLGVLIVIVIRKFPQLTLMDVDTIPEVVVEKKKEKMLKQRIQSKNAEQQQRMRSALGPIFRFLGNIQSQFRTYVGRMEQGVRKLSRRKPSTDEHSFEDLDIVRPKTDQQKIGAFLNDARVAAEEQDWDEAEKKFIAAIRLDPKSKDAYRGLAEVYVAEGELEQALETYQFILQLDPDDDVIFARLGDLSEKQGDIESAVNYYQQAVILNPNLSNRFANLADLLYQIGQYDTALEAIEQAVELEPENPKYLDILTEISIMSGNQARALDAYQQLRMANPENQKLDAFKDRIEKLT